MEKELKLYHLGYVYKDIEKQIKLLESIDSDSKFMVIENKDNPIVYRGKESYWTIRIGAGQFSNLNFELIEWIDGDCPYKEFLEQGNEGFHHIAFLVDDVEHHANEFKKKGFNILLSCNVGPFDVVYIDSKKKFGLILEYISPKRRKKKK